MEKKLLEFNTIQEFELWKMDIEKYTKSSYVKEHGTYKSKSFTRTTFVCHRSGCYKSKGKGERHLKLQGTNKINAFCTAAIKLTETQDKCKIEFLETHLGHEHDLGNLFLSKLDKETIAAKLAAKIPMTAILDEVRDSVASEDLERLHLLTRKDLYNIEQQYNLSSTAVRHKSDAVSVQAWVNEVKENGCVLLYKPQGEIIDLYDLKENDFMLVIMNEGQNQMLRKYGQDCICIDSTHGLNAYGFELHTLLVLNEIREGFPCCFCITNRSDVEAMKIFFSAIRKKIDFAIQPRVFMSDMADSYYNAWIQVMEAATFRLYCTWHVDRAWRKNLSKINSKEKRDIIYKQLRTLMQETDEKAFDAMLASFLELLLTDPETQEFYEYFLKYYTNISKCWAYCHRMKSGLNTNMHIERMHRTIKYIYLNGKHTKRLDKAISAILKFVRDKLFDQVIIINKGKLCSKINSIRSRHIKSNSLSFESILPHEEGWQIFSSTSKDFYYIHEENKNCQCKLICTDCNICFHRFSCTCLDSSIKWNMCKHVHLLSKYLKTLPFAEEDIFENSGNFAYSTLF
ncbi:uncharacterized protein LOC126738496 isoform X2 [Anthonomus grandis grandis]|uniref:uncharacterized protein LOC126738496 isoform X2 n=1 Tax=Anthonomus grandis grandis TaxID=2921223 RepID=UPI002166AF19|nr:uncharacterized protein LOC126738496 isoform X2 [Anthonomus grandis grandis]